MGGKVSSKMAAVGRVVQAVKPHAPLMKFPSREGVPRLNVQETLKTLAVGSPSSPPLLSRPPGPVTLLSGTPDSVATVKELPQRYRRRALETDEMDYIQRGGPE
ncbi:alpha-ketoglutarate dehydrogenase component 4-like isoform 2-T4 [Salvelinus alpinus]|uniref:alpha-ketoglutarate dehydrogenase component 4 isoform X2 n=1 Tax=Salvelinus sp. IW2-2015 TaxID=2691554 RepID=UPI000CDF6E69|nr:28S ribosomal protein S36, mitochondrial isoform X2 [Salvelinus alpinus]